MYGHGYELVQIPMQDTYEQERAGGFTSFSGYAVFSENQRATTNTQRQV